MRSQVLSGRVKLKRLRNNRGSTLVAALALVFLIFTITTVTLGRVASSYTRLSINRGQTNALFLADAGIRKAAQKLLSNPSYTGEAGTKLETGTFDVSVSRSGDGYLVRSTGHTATPFKHKPKKTVQAVVRTNGSTGFRITEWKENP